MSVKKPPIILAIDTSCDDTSAAVTHGITILSNVVASQTQLHQPYGGVFPTVAKQAHRENIESAVQLALKRAQIKISQVDALAVTQGPGLAPALEIGINKAKELATKHNKHLIAVNHIEGHLLSVLAQPNSRSKSDNPPLNSDVQQSTTASQTFPVLGLVVSGGHTEFILVNQVGKYQRLGWTIDDAAGECLDKVGRLLNLGYPAGPVIEEFAKQGDPYKYKFPLPMTTSGNYNLSFSGLKTFARNLIKRLEQEGAISKQVTYDLCASFQKATFRHIIYKLNKILKDHPNLGQVWLGGGVAANIQLRAMIRSQLRAQNKMSSNRKLFLQVPYTKKLCADNAAMIGVVANYKFQKKEFVKEIHQLDRNPRMRVK